MHFNEQSVLAHGIYNLGFVGFKNTEIGRGAAAFWRRRMMRHCRDDHARGLFTELSEEITLLTELNIPTAVTTVPAQVAAADAAGSRPRLTA